MEGRGSARPRTSGSSSLRVARLAGILPLVLLSSIENPKGNSGGRALVGLEGPWGLWNSNRPDEDNRAFVLLIVW